MYVLAPELPRSDIGIASTLFRHCAVDSSAEESTDLLLHALHLFGIVHEIVVTVEDENWCPLEQWHFVQVGGPLFEPTLVPAVNLLQVIKWNAALLAPRPLLEPAEACRRARPQVNDAVELQVLKRREEP